MMSRPVGALSLFTRRTLSPFSTFLSLLQGTSGRSHDDGGESDKGGGDGDGGDGGSDGVGMIIMLVKGSGDNGHLHRAPIRLPENVVVDVVIVTKREGVSEAYNVI